MIPFELQGPRVCLEGSKSALRAPKLVYYTCKVSFIDIMHIWDMVKMHIEGKNLCLKVPEMALFSGFGSL